MDATEANAPGVPEPQQDIDAHIASFARQGFTQQEMIGLVACGCVFVHPPRARRLTAPRPRHTFGGVQRTAFPDIVPELNDPKNTESNAPFDSTFTTFDNRV